MGLYTFTLEKFHIDNTRSRHEDTDTVTFGINIGSQRFPVQSLSVGDVNNGDHLVNLTFSSIFIGDAAAPIVFVYMIYNGDATKLSEDLEKLNQDVADKTLEELSNPETFEPRPIELVPSLPDEDSGKTDEDIDFDTDNMWLEILKFTDLASFLFPDCDGFVAADYVAQTKSSWDKLIAFSPSGICRGTVRYPGSDSPAGCGSNSDYTVTWSLTYEHNTDPGPYSLRSFLLAHKVTPRPGLRSLNPSSASSLRGLMSLTLKPSS